MASSKKRPCRKRRYRTKVDAMIALADTQLAAARNRKHSRSATREESRAYRCQFCRGWHLTSKP